MKPYTEKKYKVIRSRLLLPFSERLGLNTRIEDGYVLIEGNRIKEVGNFTEAVGKNIVRNHGNSLLIIGEEKENGAIPCINGVVMPGFVKAHGHNHESPIIGIARDEPLSDWLDHSVNLFTGFLLERRSELRKLFGKSAGYITFQKAFLDDVYYGITSSMNHQCNFSKYLVPDMVKAGVEAGVKLIVAVGSQDRNYDKRVLDTPDEAIQRLNKYKKEFAYLKNIEIVPGPDQDFSNSMKMLRVLKQWANEHDTIFHIHSSEEYATTQWFKKRYKYTPVEYFDKANILDNTVVLAHQVHTSENDLRILKNSGANVVHNPLANTILGSGMPPVIEMINSGIPLAISTDGSGSSDNQNILSAARLASQYQKAKCRNATLMKAQDLLERITIIPAKMLRLNTGSLEVNKDADLILIDLNRPNLTPTRIDNVMENLVWASDGSEVRWVIANGNVLKDDYKLIRLDDKKVKDDVYLLSKLLVEYIKTYREVRETGIRGIFQSTR